MIFSGMCGNDDAFPNDLLRLNPHSVPGHILCMLGLRLPFEAA